METTKWVSVNKASKRTGLSRSSLKLYCSNGTIEGARKTVQEDDRDPAWMIPEAEVKRLEIIHKARDFDPEVAFELRTRVGETQLSAAIELGVPANSFGIWELGRFKPRGEMALRYAQLRQRWVDQLLKGTSAEDRAWAREAAAFGRLALPLGEIGQRSEDDWELERDRREVEAAVRRLEGAG